MYKGTNASAGIGICKAALIKEVEMVIRPDKVASVESEVQRFRGALAETVAQTKALAEDLATKVGEKEAERGVTEIEIPESNFFLLVSSLSWTTNKPQPNPMTNNH